MVRLFYSGRYLVLQRAGDGRLLLGLTFSAGYERGHRVPNIRELFGPQFNGFPAVLDPCSPFGFNPQVVIETCPANGPFLFAIGQVGSLFGGNPDLRPEISDTMTLGVEIAPAFAAGLVITGGFFDVEIEDAVSQLPAQSILNACHLQGLVEFCPLIERNNSGSLVSIRTGAINAGSQNVRGVDIGMEYRLDDLTFSGADAGSLTFNYIATRLLEASIIFAPGVRGEECAGFYGVVCGEPQAKYKHSFMVTHEYGPLT